ncbi:TetR/AcrR family transcriptional regulator [Paenibacillus sp. M1]|uniref:TetR/AcrR family transcriptional regulator n=1 Tax=Paenibacillus haidiansis TaxID=1574488 RepID=A0ABU7VV27_9BACL
MNPANSPDPERKRQLKDTALEWFARKGYHNTKISDIVRSAGVSQGTFYWYFESKEKMTLELIYSGRDKLVETIHTGYRKEPGTVADMELSTRRLLSELFRFAASERHLMALLLIKGQGADPAVQEAVSQTWQAFGQAFRANIQRASELGMLPESSGVELRTLLLTSLIEGTISKWLFGPEHDIDYVPVFTAEQMARATARFEFYGLIGEPGQ